ncbi:hypothetical protein JTB14_015865 [Gonioctena quinquepunctata]|nr:hypothetical protein JTB14_015865 [Gonioctena quinquepunctata]
MDYVDGTKTDENKSRRALAAIVSGVKTHINTEIGELKTGKELCRDSWYVDSGASVYLTGHSDWLKNVKQLDDGDTVTIASVEQFRLTGIGETSVLLDVDGQIVTTPMKELGRKDIKITFKDDTRCEMRQKGTQKVISVATSRDGGASQAE